MADPLKDLIDNIDRKVAQQYADTDYTDSYIAFLDILGMKNLVSRPYADLRKIYNSIESSIELYARIGLQGTNKTFIDKDHLKVTIMSDALVLSIDSSTANALSKIIGFSSYLIKSTLTALEEPVFIRGCIARGKIFQAENTVFGPGLVKAYILENETAHSMRCIISPDLEDDDNFQKYLGVDGCALIKDTVDGLYFIKFATPDNEERLRTVERKIANSDADPKIKEKYVWLLHYLDELTNK